MSKSQQERGFGQRLAGHITHPATIPSLIWKNITYPFSPKAADKRYDRRLGINTSGYMEPDEFGIRGGQSYGPTPPRIGEFLISKIMPEATGFTFVDVGSGKGRMLLIAAQYPFRQIIGWEYSEILNQIAETNVRQFAMRNPPAAPITVVQGDATQLPLPGGPLVLFLFNPFLIEMARAFAACVKASYYTERRKIICIYYNPAHPEVFDALGIFKTQTIMECPYDPADVYAGLNLKAVFFET